MGNNGICIANALRNISPVYMGDDYAPVIFANIGMSAENGDIRKEITQVKALIRAGVDAIADLTLFNDIEYVQKTLLEYISVPFSSVAAYEIYMEALRQDLKVDSGRFLRVLEDHMLRGVDIITIHATVLKDDRRLLKEASRIIHCTSRGGAMVLEILEKNGYENPFYTHFEDVLALAKRYGACLSLGPTFRPGSVCDAGMDDALHFLELKRMAGLVEKAQKAGVGITIEGIGHASLEKIEQIVPVSKQICHNAPYRVLNVATDIAIGYDHIASAIGSSVAVMHGANSITAITRSEHLGLPKLEEIIEGIRCAKVAAYCGYSARTGNHSRDREMAMARSRSGCIGCSEAALFPDLVAEYIEKNQIQKRDQSCTMCGCGCPFVILNDKKGDDQHGE